MSPQNTSGKRVLYCCHISNHFYFIVTLRPYSNFSCSVLVCYKYIPSTKHPGTTHKEQKMFSALNHAFLGTSIKTADIDCGIYNLSILKMRLLFEQYTQVHIKKASSTAPLW